MQNLRREGKNEGPIFGVRGPKFVKLLLLPLLLAIELSLRCQVCDAHSKFEEDRTKTTVAIVDDKYLEQTDRQSYTQVILYLSNATHCIGQTIVQNGKPYSIHVCQLSYEFSDFTR